MGVSLGNTRRVWTGLHAALASCSRIGKRGVPFLPLSRAVVAVRSWREGEFMQVESKVIDSLQRHSSTREASFFEISTC